MALTFDFTDLDLLPAARSLARVRLTEVLHWSLKRGAQAGRGYLRCRQIRIVHEVMVVGNCSSVSGVPQRAGEPRAVERFGSDLGLMLVSCIEVH